MPLTAGTRLGPYEISALLGVGGMGEVYKATDTRLERTVAIKVLSPALAGDPQFRERFDREARTVSQLNHPHICVLHDIGEASVPSQQVNDSQPSATTSPQPLAPSPQPPATSHEKVQFLVMEFLEGETLAQRIARGPLKLADALKLAGQMADALGAAHRAGVTHRDLKPGNVMLTFPTAASPPRAEDGLVERRLSSSAYAKLLDFGLAKTGSALTGANKAGAHSPVALATNSPTVMPSLTGLTVAGSILGTFQYMSPEQLEGREADPRSDIFAFGAVLYEMVTGKKAFTGKSQVSVMAAILDQDSPSLVAAQPTTPPALDRVVRKCLAKDPEQRWQSARDLAGEIEWITETVSQPTPVSQQLEAGAQQAAFGTQSQVPRARKWQLAAAAILLPIVAAAATWAVMRSAPTTPPQPMRFAIVPPPAQPLTAFSADRVIAISADGRSLAYIAGNANNQGQLMLRAIDRLEAEPLRGITNARAPFFSPDGKWIGFSEAATELRKVSVSGGSPLRLCRIVGGSRGASWGMDESIVFATSDNTTGLLSVPAGGGEPTVLTKPDPAANELDHVFPHVLPNARAVLFTITSTTGLDAAQVAVLDRATGTHKTLVRGGSHAEYVAPSTPSTGSEQAGSGQPGYLIYAVAGTLRAVRFDSVRLEVLGDPVPVLEQLAMAALTGAAEFGVSRTGSLVYVPGDASGATAIRTLVWVTRQGREEPIKAEPRAYLLLDLSPDGTRIALDIRDRQNDIWIWDLARETLTPLTFDPAQDSRPFWTPDSRRIVYSSLRAGASANNVYWQLADGTGTVERLTTAPRNQYPLSFAPDAKRLVLTETMPTTGNDVTLMTMDEKGKTTPLVATMANETGGAVSPDGRWLAYYSDESRRNEVYVRPFPDVNNGRWLVSTAGGTRPRWARSGRELFYLDANDFLTTVPITTTPSFSAGRPTKLLDKRYFTLPANTRMYDVSPDGQRFLFIKDAPTDQAPNATPASMVVVLNWIEELKARLPSGK